MLYNRVHDSALDLFNYPDPALSLCEKHFYSLLQPEDVEDLLALWLYDTKGYVCIPSTNKIATPKYECVLVDPNDVATAPGTDSSSALSVAGYQSILVN